MREPRGCLHAGKLLYRAVYQLGVSMEQLMDSLEGLVYDKSVIVTEAGCLPAVIILFEMNCARMLFDSVPVGVRRGFG
ncbi:MAG: hypothetical protein ACLSD6_05345 [Clostridium sp.]